MRVRRYLGRHCEARGARSSESRSSPGCRSRQARASVASRVRPRFRPAPAAGPYWPTMTLAVSGGTAWVACKEQARIVQDRRFPAAEGRRPCARRPGHRRRGRARLPLGARLELDALPPRRPQRARDPSGSRSVRTRPTTSGSAAVRSGSPTTRAPACCGSHLRRTVSSRASRSGTARPTWSSPGRDAWVLTHRDNTLYRIETTTNAATRLATVGGGDAAAERLALLGGSLWITGRGVPLLEVDPETGATRRSIDIGGTGIDVVAAAGALWVPVRTAEVDRTGFPTMTALRRVTTARRRSRRQRPRAAGSTSTASRPARRGLARRQRPGRALPDPDVIEERRPFVRLARAGTAEVEAGATGLEPATSGVTGRRSNQLNYAPVGRRIDSGASTSASGTTSAAVRLRSSRLTSCHSSPRED